MRGDVILVSDAMKFTRSAPVRIGHLSQIDIFVTDQPPPDTIVDICRHNGVTLEVAPGGGTGKRAVGRQAYIGTLPDSSSPDQHY